MRYGRIAGTVFLAGYCWVVLCALLLTLVRVRMLVPRPLVLYSYGMIAPYQSYGQVRQALLAEGKRPDGTWEVIDLAPYYPVLFGERNVREYFSMQRYGVTDAQRQQIRLRYAQRLLQLEREQGKGYTDLRISMQQWPNMTGPYYANKFPAATHTEPLIHVKVE